MVIEVAALESPAVVDPKHLQDEVKIGDYAISVYRDLEIGTQGVLQILKKNEVVFEEQNHSYYIGLIEVSLPENKYLREGNDITGDGNPEIVVSHWSGGAHCCFDYYVFSLGEEFNLIQKFEIDDCSAATFEDLDNDGIFEFIGADFAFAYWHASFANSPAPQVVLKYADGEYKLALDLMAKPLPTLINEEVILADQELKEHYCSKEYWSWQKEGVCITSDVWDHMLDLIYTGHPDEAWKFLDRVWKGKESTKQWFIYDFKRRLVTSHYANQLPIDLFGFGSVASNRMTDYLTTMQKIMNE